MSNIKDDPKPDVEEDDFAIALLKFLQNAAAWIAIPGGILYMAYHYFSWATK